MLGATLEHVRRQDVALPVLVVRIGWQQDAQASRMVIPGVTRRSASEKRSRRIGGLRLRRVPSEIRTDLRAVSVGDGPFRVHSFKFFQVVNRA